MVTGSWDEASQTHADPSLHKQAPKRGGPRSCPHPLREAAEGRLVYKGAGLRPEFEMAPCQQKVTTVFVYHWVTAFGMAFGLSLQGPSQEKVVTVFVYHWV